MHESRTVPSIVTIAAPLILMTWGLADAFAAEPTSNGARSRVPWTTSRVTGSPEPPLPYLTENAFPWLKFDRCLDITNAPGTDRLFVAEQGGKIYSFVPRADGQAADLVIDVAKEIEGVREVYAITFHPQFGENRYCYICYIKAPGQVRRYTHCPFPA